MPLDGSGIALRLPDTLAVSGQTIESDKYNREINDIYSIMNQPRPISSGGTGDDNPADALANLGGSTNASLLTSYVNALVAQAFTNAQKTQARTNIDAAQSGSAVLPGAVSWFAMTAAPSGYLVADGRTIGSALSGASARANADALALFTVLWTHYTNTVLPIQTSAGGASTRGASADADFTANKRMPLPEARGEFNRNLASGRAVDTARVLGSVQSEMVGPHSHTGSTATAGAHSHSVFGGGGSGDPSVYRDGSGSSPNGTTSTNGDHTHTVTINNNTGTENRVRNVAWLCCIKY
jgi:hypothetical protein